ncbi:MAG: peptide deformylase [Nocardioidaceae bacterium]
MNELPSDGTARPMTRWGEPVMHAPCRPVERFDDDLASLVADLVATMYAADGVGLAANQVGVDLKVFVFDCADEDGVSQRGVVCNPVVTVPEGRDRQLDDADEGCLSLPGAFVPLARPSFASVSGVDHEGNAVTYEGTGYLARCLQHETDHLGGTVFGDRLSNRLRKRLYKEADNAAADFPPGWPAEPGAGSAHGSD